MKFHLFTIVLAAFVLGGCSSTKNTVSTNTSGSTNAMIDPDAPFTKIPTETFWKLESLQGKDFSSYTNNGNEVGFTMFADNKRITGYAGCNNFFGTFKIEPGNRINFSEIGATKMMCQDAEFSENDFLKIFDMAESYTLRANRLELSDGQGTPLAVFTSSAIPLNPIVEKYWKLKTLNGKKVKMEKNQEREISFTLKTKDNGVTGFAGCNSLSGNYKLEEGNKIFFSHMATTMMDCPDMEFNEWEYLKVFELADRYRIRGNKLEILGDQRAPLAVFEAVHFD